VRIATGADAEHHAARSAAWYAVNKDRALARQADNRKKRTPEERSEKAAWNKAYREANKEHIAARKKAVYEVNKKQISALHKARYIPTEGYEALQKEPTLVYIVRNNEWLNYGITAERTLKKRLSTHKRGGFPTLVETILCKDRAAALEIETQLALACQGLPQHPPAHEVTHTETAPSWVLPELVKLLNP
jgi:hypothetical protein